METLDELLFDIDSPVELTRARAVAGLVKSNDIRAVPYLEQMAQQDESAQVRYYARKGLKIMKDKALEGEQGRTDASEEHDKQNVEEKIKTFLLSEDIEERKKGIELALHIKESGLFPLLDAAYKTESDPFLKTLVLRALTTSGREKAKPVILEALQSSDHRLRAGAVEASCQIHDDKDIVSQVIPLLQDPDHRVAANAAVILKDSNTTRVLGTLTRMLDSPDVNQRDAAAFALSQLKSDTTLPLLLRAIKDEKRTVRVKALPGLESLAREGSVEAQEALRTIPQDDDKEGICDYFSLMSSESTVRELTSENFDVRLKAVKDIVKSGDTSKLSALKDMLLRENDSYVKSAIILAIGQLGANDDVKAILPYLTDPDPRIRANTVEAIGQIGIGESLEKLLPTLQDRNNRVRANAVVALQSIYPQEALDTLTTMASDPDVRMRVSAVFACLKIGNEEAMSILGDLAQDDDVRVSDKAVSSLRILKDEGNTKAEQVLKDLDIKSEVSPVSDSFVNLDDGSVFAITPDIEVEPEEQAQVVQKSVLVSLKEDYGVQADVELKDTPALSRKAIPLRDRPISSNNEEKYEVAGVVGRGGMAVIFNAKDTDLRRQVAMKVIEEKSKSSQEFIERFVEEAQVQGQLEHPNICPVHELGRDSQGRVYFTMKMVKGLSLAGLVRKDKQKTGPLSHHRLTEVLNIFLKICDGMAFAHSKGVIHRDLKPDNIMVGDFGEVYVMDWGLAKVIGQPDDRKEELVVTDRGETDGVMKTMTGTVLGTPSYMPPEQAKGHVDQMDERSDIYSLGAVLYELLTLETPFTGTTPWDILRKVSTLDPLPPSDRAPYRTIPSELNTIVMKCMEKRQRKRYRNVKELKQEIELFLAGRPISAIEYNLWQIFQKWMGRNKVLAIASVAVVIVLVLSSIYISAALREAKGQKKLAEKQKAAAEEQRSVAEEQRNMAEKQKAMAEEVRGALGRNKSVVIESLNNEASRRMGKMKYTTPAGESAFSAYQAVLMIDPGNQTAKEGLQEIYRECWKRGGEAQARGDFMKAQEYFRQGLEVNPGDKSAQTMLAELKKWEFLESEARVPHLNQLYTKDLGNGVKLELLCIPPGEFMMGSKETPERVASIGVGNTELYKPGLPRHRVRLTKGFWMGKYEVTQAQWQAVMGRNPSYFKGSNNPVEQVSWDDCQDFLKKLSQKTGERFRLPTEAEWEYACRAGTNTAFHYGDSLSSTQANFDGNVPYGGAVKGPYLEMTTSVGSYRPNAWGLYDMHGNVYELCQDWFGVDNYQNSPVNDPPRPNKASATEVHYWEPPEKCRVMRGGPWDIEASLCRSAYRYANSPFFRHYCIGFRVVVSFSED